MAPEPPGAGATCRAGGGVLFDNFLRDHLREIENISAKVLAKK
jgi:hypothetical protein